MVAPVGGQCDPVVFARRYKDTWSKIDWICKAGHCFSASYQNVCGRLGMAEWCPVCAKELQPKLLEKTVRPEVEAAIRAKGGTLLRAEGYKRKSYVWVNCSQHGEFRSTVERLLNGAWCMRCHIETMVSKRVYHRRLDLSYYADLARNANCTLLSSEYKGAQAPLEFLCNRHQKHFTVRASHAAQGHLCPICGMERGSAKNRMSLEDIREFVRSNYAGECLSPAYTDHSKKLRWRCALGHEWSAHLAKIVGKQSQWCPECNRDRRRGERMCRTFFEQVFKATFPSVRVPWLKGQKGRLMELDGYNETLKIAFEHHGRQHYEITRLSPDAKELNYRQGLDKRKRELCAKRGVRLFEIPALIDILSPSELKGEVAKQAAALGVELPHGFNDLEIDFRPAAAVQRTPRRKRMRVQAKRGKLDQPMLPLA